MWIWLILVSSSSTPLLPIWIFLIQHLHSLLSSSMSVLPLVCQVLHDDSLAGSLSSWIFFMVRIRVRLISQVNMFHVCYRIPACRSLRISSASTLISRNSILVLPIDIIILVVIGVSVLSTPMLRRILPARHICNIGRNLHILLLLSLTPSPSSPITRFATSILCILIVHSRCSSRMNSVSSSTSARTPISLSLSWLLLADIVWVLQIVYSGYICWWLLWTCTTKGISGNGSSSGRKPVVGVSRSRNLLVMGSSPGQHLIYGPHTIDLISCSWAFFWFWIWRATSITAWFSGSRSLCCLSLIHPSNA